VKRSFIHNSYMSIIYTNEVLMYECNGWVTKLQKKLLDTFKINLKSQSISRKIKHLMPDFYLQNCFKR
jgi:hypothetical protein